MARCFIIMPISTSDQTVLRYGGDEEHYGHVLEFLFAPACEMAGLEPVSPVASGADLIHAEIVENLGSSDLVLCDLSDLNPNVLFELGVRTALNLPAALVRDNPNIPLPFDTSMINCHSYDGSLSPWTLPAEIEQLSDHLLVTLNRSQGVNSLWKYFGIPASGSIETAHSSTDEKLDLLLRSVEARRERVPPASYWEVDGGEPEDRRQWLVRLVQSLASVWYAEIHFLEDESSEHSVVFDLRGYSLLPSTISEIEAAGEAAGFDVEVRNNGRDDSSTSDKPASSPSDE